MISLFSNHSLSMGYCYVWQPELVWLNALSDIIIMLACIIIPAVICYKLYITKTKTSHKWLLIGFILLMGLMSVIHLLTLISIWYPLYYIEVIFKICMAALLLAAAVLIFPLTSYVIKRLHEPDEDLTENDAP